MLPPDISGVELSPDEIARFSRHLILPEVGMEGQKRLKGSSVLCVGTGGLGSPLLLYLAAAGVGRLGIVDFDVVDHSNLQRQVIHGTSWVGKPKIESAKARILEINPHCQVDLYETALTSENALEIIRPYDIVCDGTDNFPTRYLVNDACVLLGKPNVYGSIFRFEGQATVFNLDAESPNYRDLFPEPPPPGLERLCTSMLAFDPKKRATMGQCLEDSSFDDYREDDLEARAGYRVDMEDVEEVKLESSHIRSMLYRDIRAFHRNSEPMGDRSPLASGEITPSDPHRLTMQTLTTKLDNSSILRDAREAAEMAA